jgi:hypothetical protein
MRRYRRIRLLTTAVAVCCGVALSGGAAAGPIATSGASELPRGWWAGTIVVQVEWDRLVIGAPTAENQRGSATLRITRTELERVSYELDYHEEWHGLPNIFKPECQGKLLQRNTASWRATGQIHLTYRESFGGVSFFAQPASGANPLFAPLTGESFRACEGNGEVDGPPYHYGDQHLFFGFHTTQPASSLVRQGSTALGGNQFGQRGTPRPGGVNRGTVTYDLRLVPDTTPAGAPTRLAFDRDLSTIQPVPPQRGSRMRATLVKARLVDARGIPVATSGSGGCDVAYVAGNEVRLSTRSVAGTWTPAGLVCAFQVPRQGPISTAIRTKNVQLRVAPWVTYRGKRFWAYPKGDHVAFRAFFERL